MTRFLYNYHYWSYYLVTEVVKKVANVLLRRSEDGIEAVIHQVVGCRGGQVHEVVQEYLESEEDPVSKNNTDKVV